MTQSWRETIVARFVPQLSHLLLVADPDQLITEEGILDLLREKGFEILRFDDPITFRYAYEFQYRARWDRGEQVELIVISNDEQQRLQNLPYDLLQIGKQLSFSLRDLFPKLHYQVVRSLERSELENLYQAQQNQLQEELGEQASKQFVLKHVFNIEPGTIREPAMLLHILLRQLYRSQHIPTSLEQHLIHVLRQNNQFQDWPLEQIIPHKEAFLHFLQERWPIFLSEISNKGLLQETPFTNFTYNGPTRIPFDHNDVRAYIDTLFLDGLLHPVTIPQRQASPFITEGRWEAVGIKNNQEQNSLQRIERLLEHIEKELPQNDATYQHWQHFVPRWAELLVRWHEHHPPLLPAVTQHFQELRERIDNNFQSWLLQRYQTLYSLPAVSPVMVHHIPGSLAHYIQPQNKEKIALIVMDGMAFDQWLVLKEVLIQQRRLELQENAVFAWIPTITSVSRQAIFAGKLPFYYSASIYTTQQETTHWQNFWMDKGFAKQAVGYKRSIREDKQLSEIEELISHPKRRIVGLVVDTIDQISHGMRLGTAGMHNQVRQWAEGGFLARLLDLLIKDHYTPYITADHGNIEAKGYGSPAEGELVQERGARVRIYSDSALRAQTKKLFVDTIEWPTIGLPPDYLPLLADHRYAFTTKGETIVGHGGITMEELLIPYVHVRSLQE